MSSLIQNVVEPPPVPKLYPPPIRRIQVYLSGVREPVKQPFTLHPAFNGCIADRSMSLEDLFESAARQPQGRRYLKNNTPEQLSQMLRIYVVPVLRVFQKHEIDGNFAVYLGDGRPSPEAPIFCKARRLPDPGYAIPFPIKYGRHFGPVAKVDGIDIPFREKDDRLIWRGATTGHFPLDGETRPGARAYIPSITAKMTGKDVDIGFSEITPNIDPATALRIEPFVKDGLDMRAHLRSKYILCLEGNDVATSLKWILYSNSVPVMPHPGVESWACESLLRPFTHYVPVAADLSDLADVHAWCIANEEKCERIAQNGKSFMQAFLDEGLENRLQRRVATLYSERVKLN